MHRLGFRHDNLARTLPEVLASPHLQLEGVFTHFASADVPDSPLFDEQRTRFDAALRHAGDAGRTAARCATPPTAPRCCAIRACGTTRCGPACCCTASCRRRSRPRSRWRPAMSLTSRVVAVKGLRPGEGVGYGWQFTTDEPRSIAVVPAGYADGLDTRLAGRGLGARCAAIARRSSARSRWT